MVVQGYSVVQKLILKLDAKFTIMQKFDIANFYLRQDIQAAGYRGSRSCDNTLLDLSQIKNNYNIFKQERKIFFVSIMPGTYVRDLPLKIEQKLMQQKLQYNSDILFIKDVPKAVYILESAMQDPCAVLQLSNGGNVADGEWMAIADPKSIERFVASRVIAGKDIYHQLPENKKACFHKAYSKGAEVIALQQVAYYVAKADLEKKTYTLYRDDLINKAEGIIDGVEEFHINSLPTGVEIKLLLRVDDSVVKKSFVFQVALRNVC